MPCGTIAAVWSTQAFPSGMAPDFDPVTPRLFVAVCEEGTIARTAEREAVEGHASAASLSLVPLSDPWAERRLVLCTRGDRSTDAATRLLVAHLAQQAAQGLTSSAGACR